jgi:hypothetical protein
MLAGCTLLPGAVTDLAVGDCFDEPESEGEVSDVQHRPCDQPHDAEVILVFTHPGGSEEAYPVVSGFDDFIREQCVPAFASYTGRDFDTDTELAMGYFHPTLTGWGEGDRGFTCYVYRVDGAQTSQSYRAGAPAGSPAAT